MNRHSRRLGAALGSSLAIALPLLALQPGPGVAAAPAASAPAPLAAATASPLTLLAPGSATVYGSGRNRTYVDFGLFLRANNEPFELWSTRPTYDDPIKTEWRSTAHGVVQLPEVMKSWAGVRKFLRIKILNGAGDTVALVEPTVCLAGGFNNPTRTEPTAPATSPYPIGCPYNPYTLGSVQAIQEGWATGLGFGVVKRALRPENGPFTIKASIAPDYRELFGISQADGRRTYPITFASFGGEFRTGVVDRQPAPKPRRTEPTAPSAGKVLGPLMDLRSLPPMMMTLSPKGTVLRFAATTWNGGDSPLVVDGYRDEGEDHMTAYQYFFDENGVETGYQEVGELHFHGGNHQHWHFEDFARYRLLKPDMTLAVPSNKRSWCLANTDQVDLTVPGAEWKPYNTDLSTACGGSSALAIREVLLAGSGDTYAQYRAGQAFDVSDLPNGRYIVSVEANPLGHLIESDYSNNVALRTIWLRGEGANRRVIAAPVGIVKERIPNFFG